jgi:hypothetical protein
MLPGATGSAPHSIGIVQTGRSRLAGRLRAADDLGRRPHAHELVDAILEQLRDLEISRFHMPYLVWRNTWRGFTSPAIFASWSEECHVAIV